MTLGRAALALAALFLVSLAAPEAAPAQPNSPDLSVLQQARVHFPDRLGAYVRVGISSLAPGRIGAAYRTAETGPGSPLISIYVGPEEQSLEAELAISESALARVDRNLTLVRELPAPAGAPGALGRLWRLDSPVGPILSGAIVWRRDGWRIKILATIPAASGEAGWAEVERALAAFDWVPST